MVVMIGVSDTSDEVGRYHTVSNDGDILWSSDDGISQENVWQGTYMDDQIEVINVMDKEERALVNQDFEQRNDVGPGIEYCGVQPVGGGQLEYTAGHNIEETTDHVEGNVTVSEDILEDDCVDGGNRIHVASNSNLCSDPDKDYGDVSEQIQSLVCKQRLFGLVISMAEQRHCTTMCTPVLYIASDGQQQFFKFFETFMIFQTLCFVMDDQGNVNY